MGQHPWQNRKCDTEHVNQYKWSNNRNQNDILTIKKIWYIYGENKTKTNKTVYYEQTSLWCDKWPSN